MIFSKHPSNSNWAHAKLKTSISKAVVTSTLMPVLLANHAYADIAFTTHNDGDTIPASEDVVFRVKGTDDVNWVRLYVNGDASLSQRVFDENDTNRFSFRIPLSPGAHEITARAKLFDESVEKRTINIFVENEIADPKPRDDEYPNNFNSYAVSGTISGLNGTPVVVRLNDKYETVTDKTGFYRFAGLLEGDEVVIDPQNIGYAITPDRRSIKIEGRDKTINADFAATVVPKQSLITSPSAGAQDLPAGNIVVEVDAPRETESIMYYVNDFLLQNTEKYELVQNDPLLGSNTGVTLNLHGGSYTVMAVAYNKSGEAIARDEVNFTVKEKLKRGQFTAVRLNGNRPIISRQTFVDAGANFYVNDNNEYEGDNMNGAEIHVIPDWVDKANRAHPDAHYYMIFSGHHSDYIRLAWAKEGEIEGPWHLYNVGPGVDREERGILSMNVSGNNGKFANNDHPEPGSVDDTFLPIPEGGDVHLYSHIASPKLVFEDPKPGEAYGRVLLYFHAKVKKGREAEKDDQYTLVAVDDPSDPDYAFGLNFTGDGNRRHKKIKPRVLGANYMAPWKYTFNEPPNKDYGNTWLFAFDNASNVNWTPLPETPWVRFQEDKPAPSKVWSKKGGETPLEDADYGPNTAQKEGIRHTKTTFLTGIPGFSEHEVMVTFSRVGGNPERAFYSIIDMRHGTPDDSQYNSKDRETPYYNWRATEHKELLRAEYGWEGGHFPNRESDGGGAPSYANEIRDPGIFKDTDGKLYIVYSGQGEQGGIGLAELVWQD